MNDISRAIKYAIEAHGDQRDRSGTLYIFHVLRVMERVRVAGGTDNQIAAAVLHDVLEDTDAKFWDVAEEFGTGVADMVLALTRADDETYAEYIDSLTTGSSGALLIKVCDLEDNLSRVSNLPEPERSGLAKRYNKARNKLTPFL